MKELWNEALHDFCYVSHVTDKNTHANARVVKYNIYGYPTVYHDGGYDVDVGAGSAPAAKNTYISSFGYCGLRAVPDVDVEVSCQWLGNEVIRIQASVTNNDPLGYRGDLRVYVAEIESSMNWKDSSGKKYHMPFLAYAMEEPLVLASGGSFENTVSWDAHMYNSGHGVNFGDYVTYNNIIVIAVVTNGEKHTGYSYPPSTKPFDAYYVDDAKVAFPDLLSADVHTVPEAGGTVELGVYAGGNKRNRPYLIVGGVTGTSPGFPLPGGLTLPINWDVFSDIVMGLVNSPVFSNFMGKTGVDGTASAQLNVPALPPGTVGLVMYYAYCLGSPFDLVSNPIEIEVIP